MAGRDTRGDGLDSRDARAWLDAASGGDLAAAWCISDRIRARAGAPDFSRPRHLQTIWNGRPLRGERVLIRCYHGLGDTLQFIRYVSLLRPVAREILVWAQPRLLPILATLSGIDRLLPLHDGTPGVSYDVDVEVMELPYVFRTTLATIPRSVPYLTAAPRPLDGPAPRIGIVWRGGGWDAARAFPFDLVAALVEAVPASWYQLQYPAASDERHAKLRPLPCDSIEGTAACMVSLDLVITVDTMAAHLAGALGVPVWTLLGTEPDWRWMRARADSPWYPSMRLFRQTSAGDWTSVATAVVEALVRRASARDRLRSRAAIHL